MALINKKMLDKTFDEILERIAEIHDWDGKPEVYPTMYDPYTLSPVIRISLTTFKTFSFEVIKINIKSSGNIDDLVDKLHCVIAYYIKNINDKLFYGELIYCYDKNEYKRDLNDEWVKLFKKYKNGI